MIDYYEEMSHSEKLRGDGRDKRHETVLKAFISVVALVSYRVNRLSTKSNIHCGKLILSPV